MLRPISRIIIATRARPVITIAALTGGATAGRAGTGGQRASRRAVGAEAFTVAARLNTILQQILTWYARCRRRRVLIRGDWPSTDKYCLLSAPRV
jgi:hypothetical protein